MGQRLAPQDAELYMRCDEVLHYIWDPIGVAGAPGARDEYLSYLPQVFARVRDCADPEDIVAYLVAIETERMGLQPNSERARVAVNALIEWREWISEHAA